MTWPSGWGGTEQVACLCGQAQGGEGGQRPRRGAQDHILGGACGGGQLCARSCHSLGECLFPLPVGVGGSLATEHGPSQPTTLSPSLGQSLFILSTRAPVSGPWACRGGCSLRFLGAGPSPPCLTRGGSVLEPGHLLHRHQALTCCGEVCTQDRDTAHGPWAPLPGGSLVSPMGCPGGKGWALGAGGTRTLMGAWRLQC